MKTTILKLLGVVALTILCIAQISMLWLGDMSSRNFLERKDINYDEVGVKPKIIWVNTKLAYKISEGNREYYALIHELQSAIGTETKTVKIETNVDIDYESLLRMPGIMYEYGIELTLEQILGSKIEKYDTRMVLDHLFVDVSSSNENKTYLYLISKKGADIHKITLPSKLEDHVRMMSRMNDENIASHFTAYQPSITSEKKQYIKGNVFLPLNSKETPMEYQVLKVKNEIETLSEEKKISVLEEYVNSFFGNPLLKEIDRRTDGSIIFSENMRAIVKYNPVGTLEFNITSASEAPKLSKRERLVKVKTFINECTGIPDVLKKGIYLVEAYQEGEEYVYKFDYEYNGFKLQLKDQVKQTLSLDHVLELTIKNNQITKGKWILLNIEPQVGREDDIKTLVRGYGEIVDKVYGTIKEEENRYTMLDNVECNYIMDTIDGTLSLDWVVLYNNRVYYP